MGAFPHGVKDTPATKTRTVDGAGLSPAVVSLVLSTRRDRKEIRVNGLHRSSTSVTPVSQ